MVFPARNHSKPPFLGECPLPHLMTWNIFGARSRWKEPCWKLKQSPKQIVCRVPVLTPWLEPFHCWFYPILRYLDWSSPKNTHTHMFIGAHMVKHAKIIKQKPYMVLILYYFRVAINNGWSHSQLCAVCHSPRLFGWYGLRFVLPCLTPGLIPYPLVI